MLSMPQRRASSSARRTFLDLPLVVKAMTRSPGWPSPDLARENFVGAVVVAHGGHQFAIGVSEMAGYGRRSATKRQRNSVARCVASDALPPLPQMSSLWPEVRQARTFRRRFSGSSKPAKGRSVAMEYSLLVAVASCRETSRWPLKEKAK